MLLYTHIWQHHIFQYSFGYSWLPFHMWKGICWLSTDKIFSMRLIIDEIQYAPSKQQNLTNRNRKTEKRRTRYWKRDREKCNIAQHNTGPNKWKRKSDIGRFLSFRQLFDYIFFSALIIPFIFTEFNTIFHTFSVIIMLELLLLLVI